MSSAFTSGYSAEKLRWPVIICNVIPLINSKALSYFQCPSYSQKHFNEFHNHCQFVLLNDCSTFQQLYTNLFSLFSLPEWTHGPTVLCHSSIIFSHTWILRTSSNFLINQSLFHTMTSIFIDGEVTECCHYPWHGQGRVRREWDDKLTAMGAPKSNRSLTNNNQANQLSAFSEVKSWNK